MLPLKFLFGFALFMACVQSIYAGDDDDDGDDDDNACQLPDPVDIDWAQLEGTWYDFLNTNAPTDREVPCFEISFRAKDDGGVLLDYVDTKKDINVVVEVDKLESGKYRFTPSRKEEVVAFFVQRENPPKNLIDQVKNQMEGVFEGEVAYRTDGDKYIMGFGCIKGKRRFWVFSRESKPSMTTSVKVFNHLINLGAGWNSVPLTLSPCRKPKLKLQAKGV